MVVADGRSPPRRRRRVFAEKGSTVGKAGRAIDAARTAFSRLRARAASRLRSFIARHPRAGIAADTLRRFDEHRMTVYAGNFAYSSFLALLPLLLLVLSILGFVFNRDPRTMERMVDSLSRSFQGLEPYIKEAAADTARLRGLLGIAGLLLLAWGASRLIQSLKSGFAAIWGYRPKAALAGRLRSLPLLFLLATAAVAGMLFSLAATGFLSRMAGNLGTGGALLLHLLGPVCSIAVAALILTLLYRLGPRIRPSWKEAAEAAFTAALLLEAAQAVLGFYFRAASTSRAFLGALGISLGVIVWLYAVGLVVFFGAELAAALQERDRGLSEPGGGDGSTGEDGD